MVENNMQLKKNWFYQKKKSSSVPKVRWVVLFVELLFEDVSFSRMNHNASHGTFVYKQLICSSSPCSIMHEKCKRGSV